jgi:hypothetical protein
LHKNDFQNTYIIIIPKEIIMAMSKLDMEKEVAAEWGWWLPGDDDYIETITDMMEDGTISQSEREMFDKEVDERLTAVNKGEVNI